MSSIGLVKPAVGSCRPAQLQPTTFAELGERCITWIGFVFVAGPPIAFLAIPWLVLVLSLVWALALLFTFAAALILATAALGRAGALLASPYMLIRHARARRALRAHVGAPGAQLIGAESPRAVA